MGTCGSGFDRRYPSGRVPTNPFRVLGLPALGSSELKMVCGGTMVGLLCDVHQCVACFGNPPGSPSLDLGNT